MMPFTKRVEIVRPLTLTKDEVKAEAPWAQIVAKRGDGFHCFEDRSDFIDWRLHHDELQSNPFDAMLCQGEEISKLLDKALDGR